MEELTERQSSILNYIISEIDQKGYPPSVREIGKAVGLKSPASVHNHLKTLEKYNYIRRDPSKPRAIEVLFDPNSEGEFAEGKYTNEIIHVPLIGKINAGEPVLAEENIEDYFPVPSDYVRSHGKDLFMLKVEGESMIEAGIHDGDFVISQKQNYASNGEIVIALINEEATVKKFFKEENQIRLQPENPAYQPIIVPEAKILGKVIGLYRKIN